MRILIRLAAVLVAIVALAVAGVIFTIDSLAKAAIEKGSSHALGVPTRVGSVRIGLLTGSFRMGGFRVDNPPGFEGDHMVELRSARFEVPPAALREPTIAVPLFALAGVDRSSRSPSSRASRSRFPRSASRTWAPPAAA